MQNHLVVPLLIHSWVEAWMLVEEYENQANNLWLRWISKVQLMNLLRLWASVLEKESLTHMMPLVEEMEATWLMVCLDL